MMLRTRAGSSVRTVAAIVAAVALTVSACGSPAETDEDGNFNMTLAVGAPTLTASNAPYSSFAADAVWRDTGLNVTTEYTQGAVQSAQLISAGQADISAIGLSAGLQVAAQSPNVKIIAVTGGNIWVMSVPKGSSITSLEQLKGRTIGVQSLSSAAYLYQRAALAEVGIDPDEDVDWLPIGTGAQSATAIDSGQVDAFATYYGPLEITSGLTQVGLDVLPSPLDDLDGSTAWIVNADLIEERRDELVDFIQGMSKVTLYAEVRPERIIESLWASDPTTKPRDMTDQEAMALTLGQVQEFWARLLSMGPEGQYGVLDDETLERAITFHEESGIVEGEVSMDSFDLSIARDADDYDKDAFRAEIEGS